MTTALVRHVFFWPAVIGALSIGGLIGALVGDGGWDAFSWLTLSIPLIVSAVFSAKE